MTVVLRPFRADEVDVLAGDMQARRSQTVYPPGVVEIGIDRCETGDRGRGIDRQAVTQLTTRLFGSDDAHRVQYSTDVDNAAMRCVVELLGFGFEGILRGFMPSAEGPPDHAMDGMTRADHEGAETS